eukprot:15452146-Alexandrium_andersonii.AAC.1
MRWERRARRREWATELGASCTMTVRNWLVVSVGVVVRGLGQEAQQGPLACQGSVDARAILVW